MTAPDATLPSTTIDRGIYVMPQFVTFEVSDMASARRWYVNGLGFVELAVLPGPDGDPVLVHLRRFRYQDILLAPGRDPEDKASGVRVSFAAGDEDLDARAARSKGQCALPGIHAICTSGTPTAIWWCSRSRIQTPTWTRSLRGECVTRCKRLRTSSRARCVGLPDRARPVRHSGEGRNPGPCCNRTMPRPRAKV